MFGGLEPSYFDGSSFERKYYENEGYNDDSQTLHSTYGSSIKEIDLTNFDKDRHLFNWSGMFSNCSNIEKITLPKY